MQEVLNSLSAAMTLLETKLAEVSKKEVLLKNAKSDLELMQLKNNAAENNLKAKERILAKYEDLDKEIELAKQKTQKVNHELADAEAKRISYDKKIASIKKTEDDVAETKALYVKKNASLDEQLAKTKELQEQLKSKLQSLGIK
jgi:predicted  nucleic acid-binding Zn-ribbon protein